MRQVICPANLRVVSEHSSGFLVQEGVSEVNKISIITLLVLIAAAAGVTRAYFSDSESSTGNIIAAGTLDLTVDGSNAVVTTFSLSNKAPGNNGTAKTTLANAGSLGGELDITLGTVDDDACNPDGSNDGSEFCDTNANLGAAAEMALYIDVDKSDTWNSGDIGLKSDISKYSHPTALDYAAINSYSGDSWNNVYSGLMASAASDDFTASWRIPSSVGNSIQGDDVSFNVAFTLEQAEVD